MLLIRHSENYLNERKYIFSVILKEFLGLDYQTEVWDKPYLQITINDTKQALVLNDFLFQTPIDNWLTTRSLPLQPLRWWKIPKLLMNAPLISNRLPILYGEPIDKNSNNNFLDFDDNNAFLSIDIFGSAFFMLTRYEEFVIAERDQHDRFPSKASLAVQENFLERPIINEYIEILWTILKKLWPGLARKIQLYHIHLTHDVDVPLWISRKKFPHLLRSLVTDLGLRYDLSLCWRRLQAYREARQGVFDNDPNNSFDFIMNTSEQYGWQNAFYFMYGGSSNFDNQYDPEHPWIVNLYHEVHQRGHEIGFHPSYGTYLDSDKTKQEFQRLLEVMEKAKIQQDSWGGRQHYFRWQNPTTWQNWADAGLNYDSTLCFADAPGFRCGVCYEYSIFNLKSRQHLKLRERPLIIMEHSLNSFLQMSFNNIAHKIFILNKVCRQFNGSMAILWHNDSLISQSQRNIYSIICQNL
ncbi:MAG: polysaccharide deacetylase family protein [Caldilineaceae bacterium]